MSDDAKFSTEFWSGAGDAPDATWAARRRLAAAMRDVIENLVTSDAPQAELEAAAEALERYAQRLRSHPHRTRTVGFPETANAGELPRREGAHFDYSPLVGQSNPLSPPIRLAIDGETATGTARFGSAYEGPPGHVHGGMIAAAFDEVLGFTQSMTGHPGMTGTLTIRYRKPTPLRADLRFEGRVTGVEGRKNLTTARLFAGDELCAEADGIFVRVDFERFRQLAEARKDPLS